MYSNIGVVWKVALEKLVFKVKVAPEKSASWVKVTP